MVKKKEMTINGLAQLLAKSHKGLDVKIDDLAQQLATSHQGLSRKIDEKIDGLALITAKGFERVDKRFEQVNKQFEVVYDEIRLIKDDMRDVKRTLGPLVKMAGIEDYERKKLETRVLRLERRAGIVK